MLFLFQASKYRLDLDISIYSCNQNYPANARYDIPLVDQKKRHYARKTKPTNKSVSMHSSEEIQSQKLKQLL